MQAILWRQGMIRKLRIKFTAAAAGAVFLVLAVVLTIINVMNYRQVLWEADTVLDILSEHQIGRAHV